MVLINEVHFTGKVLKGIMNQHIYNSPWRFMYHAA